MRKRKRLLVLLVLLLLVCPTLALTRSRPTRGFVSRRGARLFVDGNPYRAAGVNAYWLGLDENVGGVHFPTRFRTTDALETVAGWLGPDSTVRSQTLAVSTGGPLSFEPALGIFNDSNLLAADWAVAEAERLGLRLIVPLTDNGKHFAGGKRDFCRWCGLPDRGDGDPLFYSDPCVVAAFKEFVRRRLNHVNPFTGRRAKDEPAIAVWETGNELNATAAWTRTIAAWIKSIDANHLVMDGTYGVRASHLLLGDVDLYTDHFYPPDADRLRTSAQACADAGKVFSAGEFGWSDVHKLDAVLAACADEGACGLAAPWSFFPHADDHGFVQHGDGFTYHYPGWGSLAEMHVVRALRDYACRVGLSGCNPNDPISIVAAPFVHGLAENVVSWRGAALAATYEVATATSMSGPWRNVTRRASNGTAIALTDDDTPWNVNVSQNGSSTSVIPPGAWVRVRGVGLSEGVVGPWSAATQVPP